MSDPAGVSHFTCPYCGETEWQNHRGCLKTALKERNEALKEVDRLSASRGTIAVENEHLRREIEDLKKAPWVVRCAEARQAARGAYWSLPIPLMHLPTGQYWHRGLYLWLNDYPWAKETG